MRNEPGLYTIHVYLLVILFILSPFPKFFESTNPTLRTPSLSNIAYRSPNTIKKTFDTNTQTYLKSLSHTLIAAHYAEYPPLNLWL